MRPLARFLRHFRIILSFLIATSVAFNIALFLNNPTPFLPPSPSPDPPPHHPRYFDSDSFTSSELTDAIINLDLPTWSRGHLPCTDPRSEVTCGQIVRSWRRIQVWLNSTANRSLTARRWVLCHQVFDGIGNRMSIDSFLFILSLMSNRSLAITGWHMKDGHSVHTRGNAYDYHPSVFLHNETIETAIVNTTTKPSFWVPWFRELYVMDFFSVLNSTRLIEMEGLIYASMLYAIPQMNSFCLENFGIHALYFVANFLIKIPQKHLKAAAEIIESVPRNIFVMGVHLRLQFPGQFYSHSVVQTIGVVRPFLSDLLARKPMLIAFASDSKFMEHDFKALFAKNMIMTRAIRKADFDHESALVDMAFLEMCDDLLLSYRSTFSFSVAMRRARACFWVEKESPAVFRLSNSQVGAISMLVHAWDVNDWQTSRRYVVSERAEKAFRFDFKYFRL